MGDFDQEAFQTVILDNLLQVSEKCTQYFDENIGYIILA